jgi:primosomal protein N' (replication factor Y)
VRAGAGLKQEKLLSLAQPLSVEELAALETARAAAGAALPVSGEQQFRPQKKSLVLSRLDVTAAVAAALVKRGVVREESQRIERIAYDDDHAAGELVAAQPHSLNPEQQAAVDAMTASLGEEKFGVTLLHGSRDRGRRRFTCARSTPL